VLSLQDQFDLSVHDERFEDVIGLKTDMIPLKRSFQQDLFRDIINSDSQATIGLGQMTAINLPHPHITRDPGLQTTHVPVPVISEDTIRAAQLAHTYDNS
jgi:hypothetical protein